MSVPSPLRAPDENTARGLQRAAPGLQGGRRAGLAPVSSRPRPSASQAGLVWVEIEDSADIAAKVNPYLSFDPAGTYGA